MIVVGFVALVIAAAIVWEPMIVLVGLLLVVVARLAR